MHKRVVGPIEFEVADAAIDRFDYLIENPRSKNSTAHNMDRQFMYLASKATNLETKEVLKDRFGNPGVPNAS